MVEAVMLWNEPNNLSHWDFHVDPEWKQFSEMAMAGARAVRRANAALKIVLGGEPGLPSTRNAHYAGLNSRPRLCVDWLCGTRWL